ncbi:MAG: DUF1800 domain-containing protein [Thiotrichaceae bacterium]
MNPINFTEARHLLSRTGMGVEWNVIQQLVGKSTRNEAVDKLIQTYSPQTKNAPRLTPLHKMDRLNKSGARGKKLMHTVMMRENDVLKNWWVKQMLTTTSPMTERMTLFWHNHFTSSLATVKRPKLLLNQNKLLRQFGMGNFAAMLMYLTSDPAMLLYLDGDKNIAGSPNENFARELLELFTLGHGHYSEADIKAAALAFTGWGVDHQSGKFAFKSELHDGGTVNFLGQRGKFNGNDILKIILKQPRTAEHIAEKFWKSFVNLDRPDPRIIRQWGNVFRDSSYEISALFKAVLTSDVFWEEKNRGALIKSPIELMVGTMRILPHRSLSVKEIMHTSRILGQDLFDPPNVKGWDGGKDWISTQSLLIRTSLQQKMSRDANIKAMSRHFPKTSPETLQEWLLPHTPVLPPPRRKGELWFVQNLMFDPGYQLA